MKKIFIALLIFLVSLAALSFINNNQGGFTLLPNLPGTSEKEPTNPSGNSGTTDSPFQEDPVLEAKISRVSIKHYVQDGNKDGQPYVRFAALLSNVDDVPFSLISSVEIEVTNNATGQRHHEICKNVYLALEADGQKITAESMGGDCWAIYVMQNPQNGEYTATCTISYKNSKTKTTASRVYNHSENGTFGIS